MSNVKYPAVVGNDDASDTSVGEMVVLVGGDKRPTLKRDINARHPWASYRAPFHHTHLQITLCPTPTHDCSDADCHHSKRQSNRS